MATKRRPVTLSHTDVKDRQLIVDRPLGEAIDLPPYKDAGGRWRTTSLFIETFEHARHRENYTPIFTLREFDFRLKPSHEFRARYPEGLVPSLRQLYLSYNDPTEYTFATEVLKSLYHWKHLCTLSWFQPYLEEWRMTLSDKLRGIGIDALVRIAQGSDPKLAKDAARWLAESGFAQRRAKGRPSEQKVALEVAKEVKVERLYEDDARRLGIEVSPPVVAPNDSETLN